MTGNKYWGDSQLEQAYGCQLEARAKLALDLVKHFGSVAAKIEGEDSAGRARLALQEPRELVARCFGIADEFFRLGEDRGDVIPGKPEIEREFEHAMLSRIASRITYADDAKECVDEAVGAIIRDERSGVLRKIKDFTEELRRQVTYR